MKHLTPGKLFFLLLTLLFLSCFINPDNPVDPDYEGDYGLLLKNDTLSSELEVLRPCTVTIENTGADMLWQIYLSGTRDTGSIDLSSICSFSVIPGDTFSSYDSVKYTFCFTDTFSGRIYLTGKKPNHDTMVFPLFSSNSTNGTVKVINPYTISGKTKAGINERITLSLKYKDGPFTASPFFDSLKWKDETGIFRATDNINISCSTQVTRVFLSKLIYNSYTFNMPLYSIEVSGNAPEINIFAVSNILKLGEVGKFRTKCSDLNNDPLKYIVIASNDTLHDTLLSTDFILRDGSEFLLETERIIKEISYTDISLYVYDTNGNYNSDTIPSVEIYYNKPSIKFDSIIEPPIGAASNTITIGNIDGVTADEYYWIFRDSTYKTKSSSFVLPAYNSVIIDTLYVFAQNTYSFDNDTAYVFKSETLQIIIIPKPYYYTVRTLPGFPDTLKIRSYDTLYAGVFGVDGKQISDTDLKYTWTFTDTAASGFKVLNGIGNSSKIIYCKDSIPAFTVTIKAEFSKSDTSVQQLQKSIFVRSYRPYFKFSTLPADTLGSIINTFGYTAHDSSNVNGQISKIFYQQLSPYSIKIDSLNNGTPLTIKYDSAGTYKIIGWARDNDTLLSKKDTLKFTLKIDTPQFKDTLLFDSVSLGSNFSLTVRTAGKIRKYFWDFGAYGILDTILPCTTSVNNITKKFRHEGICTTTVQCIDSFGIFASKPMKYILTVKKYAPNIKLSLSPDASSTDSNRYIYKPLSFNLEVSDIDSDLKSVGLYLKRNNSADSQIVAYSIMTPRNKFTSTLLDTISDSGHYTYYVIATDTTFNRTICSLSVVINKGTVVIDSITNSHSSIYIRGVDSIRIYATDNDQASLSYCVSYDSISGFSAPQSDNLFLHAFPTPGWHYIYAKVYDNPGKDSSLIKDSVYIKNGEPVLRPVVKVTKTEADIIYVNDLITFSITALDINGTVDTVFADYNGDNIADTKNFIHKDDSTFTFDYKFPRSNSGLNIMRFWGIDNDKILSNVAACTLSVHKGMPVLKSFLPKSEYWVNDSNEFVFSCNDSNGTIRTLLIDWGDNQKETVANILKGEAGFTAKHAYTKIGDTKYFRISLTLSDEDSISYDTSVSILVKLGKPVISPVVGNDTLLYARANGSGGQCTVSVNITDPNKQWIQYKWFSEKNITNFFTSTNVPTYKGSNSFASFEFYSASVNNILAEISVLVMDDDSNVTAKNFKIICDGPPPLPDTVSPKYGITISGTNEVTLTWKNADFLDSNLTEYQVLLGSTPESMPIVSAFKPGTGYTINSDGSFSAVVNLQNEPNGIKSWQIIARDRSGSVTYGPKSQFIYTK